MQFNLFLEKVKLYKKQISYFFVAFFVVIIWFVWYFYFIDNTLKVLAWNFDFSYRKIPYDVGYIDFTLSQDLDSSTVNKENFVISPKIDWDVSLVWPNIIRYKFLEKLNIWDDISITLKQWLKSDKWEILNQEYNYIVRVIDWAKVLKILPNWDIWEIKEKTQVLEHDSNEEKLVDKYESIWTNLSQNIAVFFNIPMVSLTNLDKKETLPCPIEIEPKLEWTCKWTTSSVMEYIPKDGFLWATKYKVSVSKVDWLLYSLWSWSSVEISTPRLNFYVDEKFNVKDNIKIRFNFAPNLDSLKDKLTLLEWWKKREIILSNDKTNEEVVIININRGFYKYWQEYTLEFDKWIMPKYWNIPTDKKIVKNTKSIEFLNKYQVYQNIFSWSKLINTNLFDNYNNLPIKNLVFTLWFEENINILDKKMFSFEDEKGNNIDFNLYYKKEQEYNKAWTWKIVDNKKIIKFVLAKNLINSTKYKLTIKKSINSNLEADIIKSFNTSPKFEILGYKYLSYSKSCLYLNNKLEWDSWNIRKDLLVTYPASKTASVSEWEYIDYKDQVELWIQNRGYYNYSDEAKVDESAPGDDKYIEKWYCPPAKNWTTLYVVNTRLNPNTTYKINVNSDLEDEFGNNPSNKFDTELKTGDIQDKDKYLYISLNKEINLIPTKVPMVVNLQTINLDSIDVEVCFLDNNQFIYYSNNRWNWDYNCDVSTKKTLNVKNNYWNLSNNKFDIEKDILWLKTNANILLVRWIAGGRNQFSNVFIRSDLNMTLQSASNKKLLYVTDFNWNKVDNLKFDFYKYEFNNKTTAKVVKNFSKVLDNWIMEIDSKDDYNYIFASNDKYFWVVDLNYNMFSDYDFKYYWWTETSEKNYLYLYTERPIYKPGDTVYIKWLLRKFEYNWYKKSSVKKWKLEVLDSNYKSIMSLDVDLDKNSNFNTSFVIPKEVSLGRFSFRFVSGDEHYNNNAYFHIEEYRKPDFKIEVSDFKKDYSLWEKLSLKVSPEYYFWWKLVNTKGTYSILTQRYFFDAKDYSDYQFGEWYAYFDCIYWGYCSYDDNLSDYSDFKVNENWVANINYVFPKQIEDAERIYSFNIEVEDKDTKKTVNKTVSTILHSTDWYVWIDNSYWNDKKSWIKTQFVVLDYDAKPVSWKNVKIEIIKREWKQVKKQWVDGFFYNEYWVEETKESEYSLKTDKNWIAKDTFLTKDSWEYLIKATYTWANWKSFTSTSYTYVSSDDYVSWYNPNNDTTELIAEKTQVLVWEKAIYTLKSPINNWKALIIIEKDDWILDYFVHNIKTYGDKIMIPVKSNYYPNFYVRAFLIWTEKNSDLPIYKRALTATKVNTEYKKLNINILKDKQSYKPWDKVWIWIVVNDSKWNPVGWANWSISFVDESLLALVWNPKKNPYAFFYDMKRYLWTLMYSSMINLIEKLEVKDVTNWEKWWAWEQIKWWDSKKKRWVFKDTAFWQADFTTWPNWKIYIQSEALPDNLTTWVVEVLVNTPEDNKIGVAYETFTTAKKVIVNDNLPNFFWVWDEIELSPVVFNKTWRDADFEIVLEATNVNVKWWNKRKLFVKNGESKVVNYNIKVNDRSKFSDIKKAMSKVNFKINEICDKNCDAANNDEIEKNIIIKDSTTKESVATVWNTKEASFDEVIDISNLDNKIWQIKLNYSATMFNNLVDSIDYLNRYPYWCAEQKTSSVMPNVYIKKLYDSVWLKYDLKTKMIDYYDDWDRVYKQKSLDQVIKEYLVDIRKYQKNDGWFVYWYDIDWYYQNYSDFWLSTYILNSLSELEKIWYKQDPKVMENLVSYIKSRFYKNQREWCIVDKYTNCKYSELERLFALESLQNYDNTDYETYKMYKLLKIDENDVSWILEDAFVVANLTKIKSLTTEEKGDINKKVNDNIQKVINNELVYNPRWAYIWKSDWYSRVENTAMLLKVVSLLWEKEISNSSYIIENINRWLIGQKKDWNFWSTQDNAKVIDAISYYMSTSKELKEIGFNTNIKLNSQTIDEKIIDDKNKFEVFSKLVDIKNLKDKNILNISKTWKWKVYYDLSLDYFIVSKNVEAKDEWFSIIKEYYDYNEYRKIDSIKKDEWKKYLKWTISYEELKYKKDVYEYLNKLKFFKVWQLVVVRNRVITPETRDKVAFEWFIPAWAELVNPNLATSSKKAFNLWDNVFEKNEYRLDRYFGYTNVLYSGIYDVTYLVRFTHAWEYYVKPSYISEFYNAEVFGRSAGEMILVK